MTRKLRLLHNSRLNIDNLLEWNPQFFREVKGRIKGKNVLITFLVSFAIQFLTIVSYLGQLPDINYRKNQYSRYCFSNQADDYGSSYSCQVDLLNHWQINWQLFWFDIFVVFSITSIVALLVFGAYMLVADIVKEEEKGTLNFIRLTPQSATSVLVGKILGVPILLYWFIALTLPLHLISGLGAKIPLASILIFDGVVITSCAFFYSGVLLLSLLTMGIQGFKPWLFSGLISLFLLISSQFVFNSYSDVTNTIIDWSISFNPAILLPYMVDKISLSHELANYLEIKELGKIMFYGQPLFAKSTVGIGFILLNYCLWTYWIWQGLTRRFHNPLSTVFSKAQSYWITGSITAIALGFTLQTTKYNDIVNSFAVLQCFLLIVFLGLIATLSPHRQTLHDWARYRHQLNKQGNLLWKELVFGEKSPSTVAIGINLLIATAYILPSLLFFPLEHKLNEVFWGLILTMNIILVYAVIAQLILLVKSNKRAIAATITLSSLIIIPPTCLGILRIEPSYTPVAWLFTFIPSIATQYASFSALMLGVLGQWLVITVIGWQITKQLHQAGTSETKRLLDNH